MNLSDIFIPREIIEEILLYLPLPYCSTVCKYMHEVERDVVDRRVRILTMRHSDISVLADRGHRDNVLFLIYHRRNIQMDDIIISFIGIGLTYDQRMARKPFIYRMLKTVQLSPHYDREDLDHLIICAVTIYTLSILTDLETMEICNRKEVLMRCIINADVSNDEYGCCNTCILL